MDTFYCLIDNVTSRNTPSNLGWTYCKNHESEWIQGNAETDRYNTIGFVKGCDFVVHNGKVYQMHKVYQDLDNKKTIILCVESVLGCDN